MPTYHKKGNGAFIHSCHTHCEAQTDANWLGFTINGITMQKAVAAWWDDSADAPSSKHSYTPCTYYTTSPHKCNPIC